jgi:hypothetical protein
MKKLERMKKTNQTARCSKGFGGDSPAWINALGYLFRRQRIGHDGWLLLAGLP